MELRVREQAMGYAYAAMKIMGLTTGDRERDFREAWELGGRLRDQYLAAMRKAAERP